LGCSATLRNTGSKFRLGSSASTSRAMSMKRSDRAGSSDSGFGLRGMAAFLIWICIVYSASAQTTGIELYGLCSPIANAQCRGYIKGFLAALATVQSMTGDDPVACLPEGFGSDAAIDIFRRWARENPQLLGRDAALALGAALSRAYPGKIGVPCR
jgi:Rap1a immunity proteins